MFQRFIRDQRGNFALIFALAAIPVMGAGAGALDYSTAYRERSIVQDALDAAALAANRKVGTGTTSQIKAEAEAFYLANVAGRIPNPPPIKVSIDSGSVTVTTTLDVGTSFLGILGIDKISFDLLSQAASGSGRLEVALVFDTSGSMRGSKLAAAQTAAIHLTQHLFKLAESSSLADPVKIGIVPFASSVNVGPEHATASWMDPKGVSPVHSENFDGTANRFALFDTLKNEPWAGCVENRQPPYDTTDDPPTSAASPSSEQAKTLFVPLFAPDEPDNWTCPGKGGCKTSGKSRDRAYSGAPSGSFSYNNYIADDGGSCSGVGYTDDDNEKEAQARTCKYTNAHPTSISVLGIKGGPNFMCNSLPLLPLTTTQSKVITSINGQVADGATNITAGIAWGWRVLSPTEPFTEGRPYGEANNTKIMVLMTDGENTYYPNSTFNKSTYGAWGYLSKSVKRLGSYITGTSAVETRLDERSKLVCDNVKAAGIVIYTVAFEVKTQRGKDLMAYCASDPSKNFEAEDEDELKAAFDAIGTDISKLRLTR